MKRDKNLIVFSHEHHHGLIFCSRLKLAKITNNETIISYVEDFWDKHLSEHLLNEEKQLLPFLWQNEITRQFLSEYDQIRELVRSIVGHFDRVKENSLKLSKLITDHIRFEERTMFPWLEQEGLTSEELSIVGQNLEHAEVMAHHFTPEFWKK